MLTAPPFVIFRYQSCSLMSEGGSLPHTQATRLRMAEAREPRSAYVSLGDEKLEEHFHATQLAVCRQRHPVISCTVWIDVNEKAELYVGVALDVPTIPMIQTPHATLGTFAVQDRLHVCALLHRLEGVIRWWQHFSLELQPYDRGSHWLLTPGSDAEQLFRYLSGAPQSQTRDLGTMDP